MRTEPITCKIEKIFYDYMLSISTTERCTISSYVRSLIIRDLTNRGLVGPDDIYKIILGKGSNNAV